MRDVLKDPKVRATALNDHAPLLVKLHGGPSPHVLSFHDYRTLSVRFNRAMELHDELFPGGGNKPYYPYFIYKIIEREFQGDPVKLRLLNSIHLQSRDTVMKNDKTWEQICARSEPSDNFVYKSTDPSDRS